VALKNYVSVRPWDAQNALKNRIFSKLTYPGDVHSFRLACLPPIESHGMRVLG
jgi:hypothetical protein